MTVELAEIICTRCHLGKPTVTPTSVTGGFIHRMWRLETTMGTYAVKELNAEIIRRPYVLENFVTSERIAADLASRNIPAVAALTMGGEIVHQIDETFVIIYPWIDGRTLPSTSVPTMQASAIGEIIGRIHTANIVLPTSRDISFATFSNAHLTQLIDTFIVRCTETKDVRLSFKNILAWNASAPIIAAKIEKNSIISHGDIDQKNVVWSDDAHPHIIDWEGIAPINPDVEVMEAMLNWGGIVDGEIDHESMNALRDGYLATGRVLRTSGMDALGGVILKAIPWLEHNLQRAIATNDATTHELAIGQIKITTKNISYLLTHTKKLSALWEK